MLIWRSPRQVEDLIDHLVVIGLRIDCRESDVEIVEIHSDIPERLCRVDRKPLHPRRSDVEHLSRYRVVHQIRRQFLFAVETLHPYVHRGGNVLKNVFNVYFCTPRPLLTADDLSNGGGGSGNDRN